MELFGKYQKNKDFLTFSGGIETEYTFAKSPILDTWLGSKSNSSIKHKTFKCELYELINLL